MLRIARFPFFSLLAVLALVCTLSGSASAVTLSYKLKVGSTYTYEVIQRAKSEATSNDVRSLHPMERTSRLEITVLAFRDSVYVLDISSGDRRVRRYLRPNGMVIATPGEPGPMVPFFATFAEGDWQPGKPQTISTSLPSGKGSVNARWETTFTGLDTTQKKATIGISGEVMLPTDRVISRTLNAKGTMILNLETGCPERADWTISYEMNYANKEIAVIRDLWLVRETHSTSCRLTGVKP